MADQLKCCPFCGMKPPQDLIDTLYPTGSFWRELKEEGLEGLRHYFHRNQAREGDGQCWGMHCTGNMGGCGAQISGDTKEEAIAAWNTRADPVGVPTVQAGSGWKLVPLEPTDEMGQAAFVEAGCPSEWYGFANMWKAAISAAPSQPVADHTEQHLAMVQLINDTTNEIVRDICEMEPADDDHPQVVRVSVEDLSGSIKGFMERALLTTANAGKDAK